MEAKSRERIYRLIDQLSEEEVHAAERYLEFLRDHGHQPLEDMVNAPEDSEELSEEGERLLEEGYEDVRSGKVHTLREVKQELDL